MLNIEPKEASLIKHIEVSSAGTNARLRLGDLTGDGRIDYVLVQGDSGFDERYFPHSVTSATAYTSEGELLWQIGKPELENSPVNTDLPAQIYDIDRDGNNEFLCVMEGSFCVFDGKTGELKNKSALPDESAHDCFAIADLEGVGYPKNIIIKNRYHQLWAMDQNFNVLWTYKGNIGHYPVVCDINGDGKDEIIAGKVVLDAEGNVLWEMDLKDFPKSIVAGDLDMSKSMSIIVGGEKTQVYSPEGEVKWSLKNDVTTDKLSIGNMRDDCFGTEIAGFFAENNDEGYTEGIFLTDYRGNTLFKEKRSEKASDTRVCSLYNFDLNKSDMILVSREEGTVIYDGYMNPVFTIPGYGDIYFADILGDGKTQVIVYNGNSVDVYADEEIDTTKPATAVSRPQPKSLYNYTRYPYTVFDTSRFAVGYAIGQFAKTDIRTWADECAKSENENIMSRGDFCVVLAEAQNVLAYTTDVFFDVSKNDYFYNAVSTFKCLGYIDDIVGKFNPYGACSAEFALSLIEKTAGYLPLTTKSGEEELTYSDVAKLIIQMITNCEK